MVHQGPGSDQDIHNTVAQIDDDPAIKKHNFVELWDNSDKIVLNIDLVVLYSLIDLWQRTQRHWHVPENIKHVNINNR